MLAAIGLALDWLGVLDWRAVFGWAQDKAGWPLALGIVAVQTLLYMLAQPGSVLFWVAALLYEPHQAMLILTAGGTAGALAAYWFARLAVKVDIPQAALRRLGREADFFGLCLLRLMPGMPHAVLNYGAAVLRLPLWSFIASTAIGIAAKSFVYASAVHALAETASPAALLRPAVLGPLFGLMLIAGLGRWFMRRKTPREAESS